MAAFPIESRLKAGTLTVDGVAFSTQASNVRLVPKTDDKGEVLEVLSGDVLTPSDTTTWSLVIEAVQDFSSPTGLINKSLAAAGTLVPYSWKPNSAAAGVTYSGTLRLRPVEIGGDVNARLATTAEWPCTGAPTVVYTP